MHEDKPRSPHALRVVRSLRGFANESELYVGAAGREAEMHRTDLAGLALVMDRGQAGEHPTPGQISAALQLSAPATSAMLDRLEKLGHVVRTPHPTDRRSVVVEITDHALEVGGAMFGRLATHLAPVVAARSEADLETIATFLEEVVAATRAARESIGSE
ncbi:MarR family transcriptional regulator [Nocardioides psychrotolerans]|uniref:MarR family winged helix-turn-helix transcriptional regulator n=1 Tax=Nocardioides psychrotolerans TaxID=1005945 RepID=UPI0031378A81